MNTSILPNPTDDDHDKDANDHQADKAGNQPEPTDRATGDTGNPDANAPPDPFDPESLRLGQDFASSVGVKKVLTTVPCRKPIRHEFVRVRPGEDWRLETGVFEDKVNREVFLVERSLWAELACEVEPACLFLAINRQNDVFLWRVKLPGSDGRSNAWNDSSLAAARLAEARWIRVAANMVAGYYDTFEAVAELSEPEWPDLSLGYVHK